jgi:hypothetical protein
MHKLFRRADPFPWKWALSLYPRVIEFKISACFVHVLTLCGRNAPYVVPESFSLGYKHIGANPTHRYPWAWSVPRAVRTWAWSSGV